MKRYPRPEAQGDLLQLRFIYLIAPRRGLVNLAELIDWNVFQLGATWSFNLANVGLRPSNDCWRACSISSVPTGYRMRRLSTAGWNISTTKSLPGRRSSYSARRPIRRR